jgi:hypothetical protein
VGPHGVRRSPHNADDAHTEAPTPRRNSDCPHPRSIPRWSSAVAISSCVDAFTRDNLAARAGSGAIDTADS